MTSDTALLEIKAGILGQIQDMVSDAPVPIPGQHRENLIRGAGMMYGLPQARVYRNAAYEEMQSVKDNDAYISYWLCHEIYAVLILLEMSEVFSARARFDRLCGILDNEMASR